MPLATVDEAHASLQVISREIATELNEARVALEAFAERPDDRGALHRFAAHIHLARGALRLAEVYGGALLAEEMEFVARYVDAHSGEGRADSDGLDALMRAMEQLPSYVERVATGARDLPLVLLPLLNDLRAVRGGALLSEGTLAAAEPAFGRAAAAVVAVRRRPRGGGTRQAVASALPDRLARLDPWRTGGRKPAPPGRDRHAVRAGGVDATAVPAVVGRRCAARSVAGRRRRAQRVGQARARARRSRAEAPAGRRAALCRYAAGRSAQQPAVLRRAEHGGRRARRRGAPVVRPARHGGRRRCRRDRRGRSAVGTERAVDAHRRRRHPRGPDTRQGCPRHLRPQGRHARGRPAAAARDAAQDQRHARRARARERCARASKANSIR